MRDDRARVSRDRPALDGAACILPDEPWVRRVRGIFANRLAARSPSIAHAVLTPHVDGGYVVSVRAPRTHPDGADALCRKFATGGGRRAAAGINRLSSGELQRFVDEMERAFPGGNRPAVP